VPNASDDLPEPGHAGKHHQGIAGNGEIDTLQIVLACSTHADEAPQSLFRGF
jgi:hypothetical protein